MTTPLLTRCNWCGEDPLYVAYHDQEWGVPSHDDGHLFEMLILEGAQAGLSWLTILRKRENYRTAFDGFAVEKVAAYGDDDVARLLADAGIVRNRLKIASAIRNAQAVQRIRQEFGTFSTFLWQFVGNQPRQNSWQRLGDLPVRTPESDALSKELQKRGCNFVGSTIIYSFMQAVGMVNDHLTGCYRHTEICNLSSEIADR